jgi:signal transduction histidine kinase
VRGAIERRRLLQEVQDLRASFTSMLVHDLRSPLTVITAYLDMVPGSNREAVDRLDVTGRNPDATERTDAEVGVAEVSGKLVELRGDVPERTTWADVLDDEVLALA